MIKHNFRLNWLMALCCLFLCCGCELFEEAMEEGISDDPTSEDYEPRFIFGIYSIIRYPRATSLEREVTSGDGRTVWINTNPSFSSKRVRDVKIVPRPGDPDTCDLRIRLDKMGKAHWMMLGNGTRGEAMAVVIDSRYVGDFIPEIPSDEEKLDWVTLRIGIDAYTARGIARYTKKNYKHFNPKASDWFSNLM